MDRSNQRKPLSYDRHSAVSKGQPDRVSQPSDRPSTNSEVGERLVALVAIGFGTMVVPLDSSVNIDFPFITEALGRPIDAIQWIVICFVLANSSLMLVFGRLGD